jgi:hypothetical protein
MPGSGRACPPNWFSAALGASLRVGVASLSALGGITLHVGWDHSPRWVGSLSALGGITPRSVEAWLSLDALGVGAMEGVASLVEIAPGFFTCRSPVPDVGTFCVFGHGHVYGHTYGHIRGPPGNSGGFLEALAPAFKCVRGPHLISQRLLSSAAVTDLQRDMPVFRRSDLTARIRCWPSAGQLFCFRLSVLRRSITRKEAASC